MTDPASRILATSTVRTTNGTVVVYERRDNGEWRFADGGALVPGASDMRLSNLYNFRILGNDVIVPSHLAREQDDLAWCRRFAARRWSGITPIEEGRDAILVPRSEWDRMDAELGVLGIWYEGSEPPMPPTAPRCIVCAMPIPESRLASAARTKRAPLYCSDRCANTEHTRRKRAAKTS